MEKLDVYKVDLKGMQGDTVSYAWQVSDDFFSAVQGPEIQHGRLDVALRVKQTSGAYDLEFQLQGNVEVSCDRCLEPMACPINALCNLRVVLAEEYQDDGDIVTVPEKEGTINVAWHIYEFAALQIPMRHVHAEGECKARHQSTSSAEENTDPRWEALKAIKKEIR